MCSGTRAWLRSTFGQQIRLRLNGRDADGSAFSLRTALGVSTKPGLINTATCTAPGR